MFDRWPDYELVDFGNGRKLERFGEQTIIRPCPAADSIRPIVSTWDADAEFVRIAHSAKHQRGQWISSESASNSWVISFNKLRLELRRTPFGHIGLFPDHAPQWTWIERHADRIRDRSYLNLFAYTGVLSLMIAAAGGRVTHVDSSSSVVRWARRNAELSGMEAAPIRWIVEDAMRFAQRSINRGTKYDGCFLDPPAFGRGPRAERWQIDQNLGELLTLINDLLVERPHLVCLSAHSEGWNGPRLRSEFEKYLRKLDPRQIEVVELGQRDRSNRILDSGWSVRWAQ
jgi:23S rRNA (cytosine1962-C5)-methyltransferase